MGGFGSAAEALLDADVVVPVKDWRAGCVSGSCRARPIQGSIWSNQSPDGRASAESFFKPQLSTVNY